MKYEVEETGALKRKLKITVPEDVVSQRVRNAYRELNKQMRMPGFRQGKIPRNILEKQVPLQSFSEMFQQMMQEYYDKVLKATGLEPVGEPEIDHSDIEEIKKDAPFTFSVRLDIKPSIKLKPYKGLKFKKKEHRVDDEEVSAAIHKILEPLGRLEPCPEGHPVEKGDVVVIDFNGFLNGEPLEKGDARDYRVRIGEKKMISGFEEQIMGHKKGGEFEVKVQLPQNWNNKMRRVSIPIPSEEEDEEVEAAVFRVKLKDVSKVVPPELTDELVRRKEIGMESVDRFRRAVKSELQAFKDHQEDVRIKEDIFNRIIKENDIDPPESAVNRELKFMIEGMKFQIEQSGMSLEDSGFDPEQAKVEWREKAEFNSKGYTLLEEIANLENIHITQSDLEEEYKRLAEETKQPLEEVRARMMNNRDSLGFTTSKLRGQKALNLIYSHCEFEFVNEEPEPVAEKV